MKAYIHPVFIALLYVQRGIPLFQLQVSESLNIKICDREKCKILRIDFILYVQGAPIKSISLQSLPDNSWAV